MMFTADDGVHGNELWITDGTAAGTTLLADLNPGAAAANPYDLTTDGELVYFAASDGTAVELWRTNGTAAGTYALSTAANGANPQMITASGQSVFYSGSDTAHGAGLFVTDGTSGGTRFLDGFSSISGLTAFAGGVIFQGTDAAHGAEAWFSDGTVAGTHLLADITAGSAGSNPTGFTVFDGAAYFAAGSALWKSDGTAAGTSQVVAGSSSVVGVSGGELYFTKGSGGSADLWVTDGTANGAVKLTTGDYYLSSYAPQVAGGKVYYNDQPSGQTSPGLYVANGVAGGGVLVANVYVGSAITAVGQHLVFTGEAPYDVNALYVSDGAPGTTTRVASGDIVYGSQAVAGGQVFFDFTPSGGNGQLWVSDGTAAGTHLVLDPGAGRLDPYDIRADGADVLFNLTDAAHGSELWISDGTAAGTHLVKDVNPPTPFPVVEDVSTGAAAAVDLGGKLIFAADVNGALAAYVQSAPGAAPAAVSGPVSGSWLGTPSLADFTAVGGHAFYAAGQVGFTSALWVTSGAPGDAIDLTPTGDASYLTVFAGALYFQEQIGSTSGLYRSDGTLAGTSEVSNMDLLGQPVVVNGKLLIYGDDGVHGSGLFASNGAAGGLSFLGAISVTSDLTVSGGKAFFVATSAAGQELWVSDGTAGGTAMVEDIAPGATGSDPAQLTAYNGGVIFTADDQTHGLQPWFSDGTAAGTRLLDVNATKDPSTPLWVYSSTAFNGRSFFVGSDGAHGDQLFSTNGALAGTVEVANLGTIGGPYASSLSVVNGKLLFADNDNLWVSDGTGAGTTELTGAWGLVGAPKLLAGQAYFTSSDPNNPAYSNGLYETDGTSAGTHLVLQAGQALAAVGNTVFAYGSNLGDNGLFAHDSVSGTNTFLGALPGNVAGTAAIGGELYFGVTNNAGTTSLWKSDGTAAGTGLVEAAPAGSSFGDLTVLGGKLYFESSGTTAGIWTSDGTAAGTTEVASVGASQLTAIGGALDFVAFDPAHGNEVWSYTPGGSAALIPGAPLGIAGSSPYDLIAGPDGRAYFIAKDATGRAEVWHVNAAGTAVELTSPTNGAPFADPLQSGLTVVGAKVFFGGTDSVHGDGLFVTNGTQVSFLASVTINSAISASAVGSLLYFQGYDPVNGSELWVSDGTAAGTHRVTDTQGPSSANASDFTVAAGEVFFSATDGTHGQELWAMKGSGAAQLVADLNPGLAGSTPSNLTAFAGALYFTATTAAGTQLWRSDGTAIGTTAISTAANGANPQDLIVDGGKLFYYGADSAHGAGLFVTDGTAAGTHFLLAFALASGTSPGFTVAGGELYFNGPKPGGGTELWQSDGTVAGTLATSPTTLDNGSNPQNPTPISGHAAGLDFNGDGRGDFLIENTAGAVVVGDVGAGGQTHFTQVSGLGPEWRFVGSGDFLDHGRADFLIENTAGVVALGEVGANGQASYTTVGSLGPEWSFRGAGDFLGHGDAQFLIENAAGAVAVGEIANGHTTYVQVAALGPEWAFHGAGDFFGDGKSDFLIENAAGAVVLGEVGANGQAAYTQVGALGPEWSFRGVGDLLGDGKSDFLIENASGAVVAGEVGAGGQASYTVLTMLGPEWSFRGVADYLGEGHDQMLIENAAGAVVIGDYLGGQMHYTQVSGLGSEWLFHP